MCFLTVYGFLINYLDFVDIIMNTNNSNFKQKKPQHVSSFMAK